MPLDVVATTSAHPIIVHSRVVELLRANGFTGWFSYPVRLFARGGAEFTGYAGLAVTGRSGAVDRARSRTIMKRFPRGEFPVRKGLFFDPESWDGSDLFIPGEVTGVFVLDEVKLALERGGVRGFDFEALPDRVLVL